jgi:hypothetical protein
MEMTPLTITVKEKMTEYEALIERKLRYNVEAGFDVHEQFLNSKLFDFQKYIVRRALRAGKFALFVECGGGKTPMQLEWANQVFRNTTMPVIILCPLAVSGQTIEEGQKFGYDVRRLGEGESKSGIHITNYEQIEKHDLAGFGGVVLDESSILKNFNGATKKKLLDTFARTPYKLCCTATPSPNDDMEITNHAEFLNQGRSHEILAMYFTHDGGDTGQWRLKGHARKRFWTWVKTWSVFMSNPSDLGFDGSAYVLPKLNLLPHEIKVPVDSLQLFNNVSISATDFNQELRKTLVARMDQVIEIVNSSPENFIIWVKQNIEADYLMERLTGAVEVRGSEDPEIKEKKLLGFARNEFRVLITKTKIAQFGLNYQNCHNQVFAALDFSFESLYQAIRRSYRFGQKNQVNIHLITTDTMQNVIGSIRQKQNQFEVMKSHLTENLHAA